MANVSSRRDANEPEIVKALLDAGCSVQKLTGCSSGTPDLLVGRLGVNYLIEVKSKGGCVGPSQSQWMARWAGAPVHVVYTVDDALAAVGIRVAA